MRYSDLITELELPKNQWELIISNADKEEAGENLVDLVQQAYSSTPLGSHVNSLRDVIPSDWEVIDWDPEDDVDATMFFRKNRAGETWTGNKIQGIGHDGQRVSKDKVIQKVRQALDKPGWWIESSDAMAHVLGKMNAPLVNDEAFLQKLFNDPNLKMIDDKTYVRKLGNGQTIKETVFGKPKLQ